VVATGQNVAEHLPRHTDGSNCPRYHKKRVIQVGHCNWHGMAFNVMFLKFNVYVVDSCLR
jgi:hypothetical protein